MNLETLRASLKKHEGVKAKLYRDTEQHLTGGVGHNFDEPLPAKLVDLILDYDISVCIEELDRAFPIWRSVSTARQNVLIELQFNLGATRLGQFVQFWAAVGRQDWITASAELLKSHWATQVKGRADTLAKRFLDDVEE